MRRRGPDAHVVPAREPPEHLRVDQEGVVASERDALAFAKRVFALEKSVLRARWGVYLGHGKGDHVDDDIDGPRHRQPAPDAVNGPVLSTDGAGRCRRVDAAGLVRTGRQNHAPRLGLLRASCEVARQRRTYHEGSRGTLAPPDWRDGGRCRLKAFRQWSEAQARKMAAEGEGQCATEDREPTLGWGIFCGLHRLEIKSGLNRGGRPTARQPLKLVFTAGEVGKEIPFLKISVIAL